MTNLLWPLLTFGVAVYAFTEAYAHLFYRWWVYRQREANGPWEAAFVLSRPDREWVDMEGATMLWPTGDMHVTRYKTKRRPRWAKR